MTTSHTLWRAPRWSDRFPHPAHFESSASPISFTITLQWRAPPSAEDVALLGALRPRPHPSTCFHTIPNFPSHPHHVLLQTCKCEIAIMDGAPQGPGSMGEIRPLRTLDADVVAVARGLEMHLLHDDEHNFPKVLHGASPLPTVSLGGHGEERPLRLSGHRERDVRLAAPKAPPPATR